MLLIPFVLGLLYVPNFYGFSEDFSDTEGFKILALNIRAGKSIVDLPKQTMSHQISTFKEIISNDVDVLCLQEMNYRVSKWLNDDSIFYHSHESEKGTFIASKHPIINFGEIDFREKLNSCIWVDIDTDIGKVRIYNVHFQSNRIYDDTEKAISEGKDYNPNVFTSLKLIFNKYNKYSLKRVNQAKMVKAHIQNTSHPVILSGDFNETSMSYLYRYMKSDMNDAFAKSAGFGNSFPQSRPIFRIDYILYSKNIECHKFENLRNISLSDHVPSLTTFGIKK